MKKNIIELEDLPKSEKIIEKISDADRLTKFFGLEHGFLFCDSKDKEKKLIVDNICTGTNCNIEIIGQKCNKDENSFHTHPFKTESKHSVQDIFTSSYSSYFTKKPNISCVKGDNNTYIECIETNVTHKNKISTLQLLLSYHIKNKSFESQEYVLQQYEKALKPKRIVFPLSEKK